MRGSIYLDRKIWITSLFSKRTLVQAKGGAGDSIERSLPSEAKISSGDTIKCSLPTKSEIGSFQAAKVIFVSASICKYYRSKARLASARLLQKPKSAPSRRSKALLCTETGLSSAGTITYEEG